MVSTTFIDTKVNTVITLLYRCQKYVYFRQYPVRWLEIKLLIRDVVSLAARR